VAERYAPGFNAAIPLIGWSMTKMAINALAGILVQDGALRLSDTALLSVWRHDGVLRREITLDQLLRMTSGLIFNEDYVDQSSDILQMLFVQGGQARFAASKQLVSSPGAQWSY
jgi:CubicO group peptidase (beta-lactamase class C family)